MQICLNRLLGGIVIHIACIKQVIGDMARLWQVYHDYICTGRKELQPNAKKGETGGGRGTEKYGEDST